MSNETEPLLPTGDKDPPSRCILSRVIDWIIRGYLYRFIASKHCFLGHYICSYIVISDL
jgi:hypothetical protein